VDETTFQTKLTELMSEISTLPATEREKLETLAKETQERHQQLRQSINSLQESLDWLRLSVKYLVFDLEATRRENAYLRHMLESNSEEGNG
jgi:predicted  nucleic acid-binding Zn-ribbon protein